MGFSPLSYLVVQGARVAQDFVMVNQTSKTNVFRWNKVRLNLPWRLDYDPSLPWVSKVRENKELAADIFQYVDDVRPTGNSEDECWEACHTYGSWVNHLGLQDASKKADLLLNHLDLGLDQWLKQTMRM